jgi:23S rRNA (guanine745-N1)-methyltransferase
MDRLVSHVRCPICDSPLHQEDRTVACVNRHSFDVARAGYLNLLAAGGRAPRTPGDTKEMLQARTRFVRRGFFRPLIDAVGDIVRELIDDLLGSSRPCVLDVGCGEGYLIGGVQRNLAEQLPDHFPCFLGSDVSKEAARQAARHHPEVLFVVADTNVKLPFAAVDVLLNAFAPRNPAEFHRVTRSDARVLVVIPTARHLIEARQVLNLLNVQGEKERVVVEQLAGRFELTQVQPIEYAINLNQDDVGNLILMTPNYWHRARRGIDERISTEALETTVSLSILLFRRVAGHLAAGSGSST